MFFKYLYDLRLVEKVLNSLIKCIYLFRILSLFRSKYSEDNSRKLEFQLTSEEVVRAYIERIKEIQPILNCVTEDRFEDALVEAKRCDELLKSADAPSAEVLAAEKPFFGVPFTTKVDNLESTLFLLCFFFGKEKSQRNIGNEILGTVNLLVVY